MVWNSEVERGKGSGSLEESTEREGEEVTSCVVTTDVERGDAELGVMKLLCRAPCIVSETLEVIPPLLEVEMTISPSLDCVVEGVGGGAVLDGCVVGSVLTEALSDGGTVKQEER